MLKLHVNHSRQFSEVLDILFVSFLKILLGNKDAISISWSYEEIQEVRTRWYCLQVNMNISFLFLSLKPEPALGALSETPLKTALGAL